MVPAVSAGSKGRDRRVFICSDCGEEHVKWHGKCGNCGKFGTIPIEGAARVDVSTGGGGAGMRAAQAAALQMQSVRGYEDGYPPDDSGPDYDALLAGAGGQPINGTGGTPISAGWLQRSSADTPQRMTDLGKTKRSASWKIPMSGRTGREINRVLGGGVTPGSLVLVGGDPGVGKSTMMLQVAAMIAHPELDFDAAASEPPGGGHCYGGVGADGFAGSSDGAAATTSGPGDRGRTVMYITGEYLVALDLFEIYLVVLLDHACRHPRPHQKPPRS